MVEKGEKVTKRINLLPYFDAFATLSVQARGPIITSFVEHAIADLGFQIDLGSGDLRNVLMRDLPEMVDVVTDVVERTLLGYGAEKYITVRMIAPFIYSIDIQ